MEETGMEEGKWVKRRCIVEVKASTIAWEGVMMSKDGNSQRVLQSDIAQGRMGKLIQEQTGCGRGTQAVVSKGLCVCDNRGRPGHAPRWLCP